MSEKRFIIDAMNPLHIHDNGTGEVITARSRMCDLLNELAEENEQLRNENKEMRHELDSLSGCYCADNKEFKDYWRIEYGE